MKYFLIEENSRITQAPKIINWHEKIDVRNIHRENAFKLPMRELVFVKSNPELIFTDIISSPFFLVSEKVKKTIQMYEPKTVLKELVLLDKEYEKAQRYYLPVFEEVECLAEGSIWNFNCSEIRKIVLNSEKIKEFSIFQIAGAQKQYIVGNLEIVESILRRGCKGILLTELDVVSGKEKKSEHYE